MQSQSNFCFIVPVWGSKYTTLFAQVCLPLILTEGNLRHFSGDSSTLFIIATTYRDAEFLKKAQAIEQLQRHVRIKWILIDGIVDIDNPHRAMSDAYLLAMQAEEIIPGITNFVFLTPDSFWSDGTFRRLCELSREQYKVVMVLGLRLNYEQVYPGLMGIVREHEENPVISNSDLVELALKYLHPMSKAQDWVGAEGFISSWPSHIYWKFGHDLMVAHCFHLHPLLVRSPKKKLSILTTIDGDLLTKLGHPKRSYYIVQNSSEIVGLELSTYDKNWGQPLGNPYVGHVRSFAVKQANPYHWHFFEHRIAYSVKPDVDLPKEVDAMVRDVVKETKKAKLASILFYYLIRANLLARLLLLIKKRLDYVLRKGACRLMAWCKYFSKE